MAIFINKQRLAGGDDDDGVWVRECRGGCAKNRWTQRLIHSFIHIRLFQLSKRNQT